jgi:glycosyltransferase involved in cell wall biosynthesis
MLLPPARKLAFRCRLDAYTGYGQFCTQVAQWLLNAGHAVEVLPLSRCDRFGEPPVQVAAAIPPYANSRQPWELVCYAVTGLPAPTPGKRSVVWTMWESTRLPAAAVRRLNEYDLVLVPSVWCATVFSASGVDRPIRIVPLGIDTQVFSPGLHLPAETVVFGTAAGMANSPHRKGFDRVVKAFRRAFDPADPVRLRVKALPGDPLASEQVDPRIEVVKEFYPDARLAEWYRSLHVFVSDSGGEGWGLMQQQAMACGVPLMAARFGGVAEFFEPAAGWAVDFTLKPGCGPYEDHGLQAQMDEAELVGQMRRTVISYRAIWSFSRDAVKSAQRFCLTRSVGELLLALCKEGYRLQY